MLNYFPKIYDYELFYSIYSRLKQDINVQSNQSFKEIVFKRPNEYIEIFYINEPSDALRSFISKNYIINDLYYNHTMFFYWSVFLNESDKENALRKLISNDKSFLEYLSPRPKYKHQKIFLKYCPLCAKENREQYHETYWNAFHQIPEINVCVIHGCKLKDSSVHVNNSRIINFLTAENCVNDDYSYDMGTIGEIKAAKYLYQLVVRKQSLKNGITMFDVFYRKLVQKKYINQLSWLQHKSVFLDNFKQYLSDNNIKETCQIKAMSSIFLNKANPLRTIHILLFLDIQISDIFVCKTAKQIDSELIERIRSEYTKDNGINKLAKQYHILPCNVSKIINGQYEVEKQKLISQNYAHSSSRNIPPKGKRYSELDKKYYPKIEYYIDLYFKNSDKVRRLTVGGFNVFMQQICQDIRRNDFYYMPQCYKYIKAKEKPIEDYWVDKIKYIVDQIDSDYISYSELKGMIHIIEKNMIKAMDILQYRYPETYLKIQKNNKKA